MAFRFDHCRCEAVFRPKDCTLIGFAFSGQGKFVNAKFSWQLAQTPLAAPRDASLVGRAKHFYPVKGYGHLSV
jgi:hypothetical protein